MTTPHLRRQTNPKRSRQAWTFLPPFAVAVFGALLLFGCASTGNNFDESKLSQIQKGETTEAQLIEFFGQPENRTVTSEGTTILTWTYTEATVKGESFIPYAGPFVGGTRSKAKTLRVTLADNKVTSFTYSGGGNETRGTTQDTPKK
jgi:outer membrane protein assembly factor BamE (lipoprotein component of BamABCDE complex)